MKASDYVIQFLAQQGAQHVFQVIGGAITHLVDSMIDNPEVLCITTHHEQGAGFAAEGYARCNGKIGVAMATSGPGATNLITAIGSCFFDSIPTLFITGQVNTYEYKFDKPVRQIGFQETDIVSIIKPITKGARLVSQAKDLPRDLMWALQLAQSGRPGPVLLDIPMDVQRTDIDISQIQVMETPVKTDISADILNKIIEICQHLSQARRPVILAGGGVRAAQACEALFEFIDHTQIPVVSSLMGMDAFPHTHPAYVGMIGAYGNRYANLAVANADFLLVLGSRLDTRQTGTRPQTFAREATIVHVDIDPHELNRTVKTEHVIEADVKDFLKVLLPEIKKNQTRNLNTWQEKIKHYKKRFPSYPLESSSAIDANEFIHQLALQAADNAIIVLDVGQHQMWAAQSFMLKPKQRMLISGGMGAMGFALPAAIGAAFAEPDREIIVIVGDGGFQMNIQELQTIVRHKLAVKIVLMNNKSLGMVRQFQQIYFNGRMEGTVDGYDCPDFIKLSHAYGLHAKSISKKIESEKAIAELLSWKKSSLLEVMLPQLSRVEPKLVVNHPVEDQDPKISREELAELMLIPPLIV
jgi:acetolactate synthase-1/2/3 large subunit